MTAILSIASPELNAEDLQDLTRDLCLTLNRDGGVNAELPLEPCSDGTKGVGLELIGQIAIQIGDYLPSGKEVITTTISHGIAIVLLRILSSYFERYPTIIVKIKRVDGKEIMLRKVNLAKNQLDQTVLQINEFFGIS